MSSRSATFGVLLCYYGILAGFTMESDCSTVRIRCSCSDGICCSGHHGAAFQRWLRHFQKTGNVDIKVREK
ncbi:hypothetical protein PF005_g25120 [Phytophthora fragariae]|uniref:Secreted protein n=2 Tax=Phytophthora TaxID=4783 RepID=A0A6A3W4W6_9STRA|nr:hypothetical protein PF003_g5087 [Phytophthora fragariae]KAE8969019.1 hypothetical protein PR001_g27621 [Phytophthora rubi]KAE8924365.1 hypothetical protein PF009_g25400 [Phytophthora fragariae]KAE8978817.1 hypothetical protein PF011_g23091 [Phytophthora fragariae]KAE9075917.1 hypothetical protein PF010_g24111 [Phytophthora fragariae]